MPQQSAHDRQPTPQPFGPAQPRWRVWLLRAVVFSMTFALLLVALSFVGTIVEKFFLMIYTE